MKRLTSTSLTMMVREMKLKDRTSNRNLILEEIKGQTTLTGKCIIGRAYLTPQSTEMESICRHDLKIGKAVNETSGDGCKNGKNYEIKISLHASKSKINFVQIRPDHDIDYYILIAYNMYDNDSIGKGYIFKVPSEKIYQLVIDYGGYAHGTCKKLGKITTDNIKGRGCEYALRCDPNAKKGKSFALWNILLDYEVSYEENNF